MSQSLPLYETLLEIRTHENVCLNLFFVSTIGVLMYDHLMHSLFEPNQLF